MMDTKQREIREEEESHKQHLLNIKDNMKHLCRNKFEKNCRSKKLHTHAKLELTAIGVKAKNSFKLNLKDDCICDDHEDDN